MFGGVALAVDDLVFLKIVYRKIIDNQAFLFRLENLPDTAHVFADHFFESTFYHRQSKLLCPRA